MRLNQLLVPALLLVAIPAGAQIPDRFTNLQVLPKDTSKAEPSATMRRFAFALGVRCEHCHVQKADKTFDYAADDKQEKKTARLMLQMVAAINSDYISKVAQRQAGQTKPVRVECVLPSRPDAAAPPQCCPWRSH